MCLVTSNVVSVTQWNWEGDTIVHNPIIPASRKVPGTRKRYEIDIREYISNKDNAVIKRTLDEIIRGLPEDKQAHFRSHNPGSFDFRMRAVTAYVSEHIRYEYRSRRFDDWLFPEETLAKGSGDCEDRAFLLASLLLSAGISSYVVRVALGKIYNQATQQSRDHIWVMYKNESGIWMLIEPLLYTHEAKQHSYKLLQKTKTAPSEKYEYIPYFIFNDAHLWNLKNNTVETKFLDYLNSRQFWTEFNPEFAAGIHNYIFDEALKELNWPELLYVKGVSMALDLNPAIYDPRDHFDNGYISESWKILNERLRTKTLDGLACAGHAIADFYAHSSYPHFAKKDSQGELVLFGGSITDDYFEHIPDYGSLDFDLHDTNRFTVNVNKCSMSRDESINFWDGHKIISGRFAQPSDPYQGFLEKTFVSIPYALRASDDFKPRTCLPHHNEIAVDKELDDGKIPDGHKLYTTHDEYANQFKLRKNAAVRHIQQLYEVWRQ